MVERTNTWNNAHKKLPWCTERRGQVIDFWIAFSKAVIVVSTLIRQAWTRYRWGQTLPPTMIYCLLAQPLSGSEDCSSGPTRRGGPGRLKGFCRL